MSLAKRLVRLGRISAQAEFLLYEAAESVASDWGVSVAVNGHMMTYTEIGLDIVEKTRQDRTGKPLCLLDGYTSKGRGILAQTFTRPFKHASLVLPYRTPRGGFISIEAELERRVLLGDEYLVIRFRKAIREGFSSF